MDSLSEYAKRAEEAGPRLTDSPLQMTFTTRLGATQQELFDYISDTDRLSEWIPGAKKTWSDDSKAKAPKQVGSVRMIKASFGKPTREVVKAYEAPHLLAYSLTEKSTFGLFSEHLGVVTCEPHTARRRGSRRADHRFHRCSSLRHRAPANGLWVGRAGSPPDRRPALAFWRHAVFGFLSRNAMDATRFFKIPSDQVVEVGAQVEL